uniref:Uncharacterized protein n=1 Tax=Setaria digitata TaxID=48799 RepID=A0A915PLJ1_9BILA
MDALREVSDRYVFAAAGLQKMTRLRKVWPTIAAVIGDVYGREKLTKWYRWTGKKRALQRRLQNEHQRGCQRKFAAGNEDGGEPETEDVRIGRRLAVVVVVASGRRAFRLAETLESKFAGEKNESHPDESAALFENDD